MPKHKEDSQPVAAPSQIDSLFWIMLASMAILCTATILIWYCMPASSSKTVNTPPRVIASIEPNGTLNLLGGNHLHLSIKDSQLFEVGCTYIITTNKHLNIDTLVSYQKISCP